MSAQGDMAKLAEWEPVKQNGKGPGKISHHTASPCENHVMFYGGIRGEDSMDSIYCFTVENSMWTNVIKVS